MKLLSTALSISTCFVLASCAKTVVSVKSNPPGAKVVVSSLNGNQTVELGQTPLNMSSSEIIKKIGKDTAVKMTLEKEGYFAKEFLLTGIPFADTTLSHDLVVSSGFDDTTKTNKIIDGIFEAQRLARAKRFDDALKKIEELKGIAPTVAVLYEMEGGIHYINADFNKALDAYTKAIQYYPGSAEAQQVINLLKVKHGVSRVEDIVEKDRLTVETPREPSALEVGPTQPADQSQSNNDQEVAVPETPAAQEGGSNESPQ